MTLEIQVDPDDMDHLINCGVGQVIMPYPFYGPSVADNVRITDGAREIVREPKEVLECYFEPLKVTINEDGEYNPYLWSDQKIVNMAVMSGCMNGEELQKKLDMFHRYMVVRW